MRRTAMYRGFKSHPFRHIGFTAATSGPSPPVTGPIFVSDSDTVDGLYRADRPGP